MSRRAGFTGSARERWSRNPSRVESDSEEGEEATTDESPDACKWGPYPFSTYSLDNEFPAATRQLALNECAREFRRYYEGLQAPNIHLGFSLMSFVFMLRLLKPVLFPGYSVPFEEGWEYISDGCRVTHVLENAVPWVLTIFLLRFGFQSHSGTGRLLRPPHVIWYHVIMILLTMGSCAVRPPTPEHPPKAAHEKNISCLLEIKNVTAGAHPVPPPTLAEAHAAMPDSGRNEGGTRHEVVRGHRDMRGVAP